MKKITEYSSKNVFKFGCGTKLPSTKCVGIPAMIGEKKVIIKTDVVEGDLPLLFSKESMKQAGSSLDFKDDTLLILGQKLNLVLTSSGHYALPIGRNRQVMANLEREPKAKVTFHMKNITNEEAALKLHRQFSHPPVERLVKLVRNQDKECGDLVDAIREVTKNCQICTKMMEGRLRGKQRRRLLKLSINCFKKK